MLCPSADEPIQKNDTTDKYEVGDEVGLTFMPEDIHVMSVSR